MVKLTTEKLQYLPIMTDIELLSEFTGKPYDFCANLYANKGSLTNIMKMTHIEWVKAGITDAKARNLILAKEIGRRSMTEVRGLVTIRSSKDSYQHLRRFYPPSLTEEVFYLLLLNRRNVVTKELLISIGGAHGTVVDTKVIFRHALDYKAGNIIVCHNHPSNSLVPSQEDISLTKKIAEICKLFSIGLLDHIIMTDNGYFSFADEGKL